ncbi:hypothetical protein OUZ56_032779 [Daphnia magna]|uniref:Uncharacterized protein n=1 Tax=Daphnia magna TaxID=35525 RepID=A0ABQ9ZXE2_9CRUS|nr:hypothetical protein OUZ56_032779 [Daphnia magna]
MTERQGKGIIEKDEFKYLPSGILITSGGKIVVQATLRRQIMELYHDQKLAGKEKSLSCSKAAFQLIPIADYVWHRLAMDIVGVPESNKGNNVP